MDIKKKSTRKTKNKKTRKKGGFFHESVNTTRWALKARQGNAPYKGVYMFEPLRLDGNVGSPGGPVILY